MPINVGDILQLVDRQTFLNQVVNNVYHYEVTEVDPDVTYAQIAQQFELLVLRELTNFQSYLLTHVSVEVRNLTNGIDIWEEPINTVGEDGTGQALASFYSFGIRLVRTNASTRHGSKRIAGCTEDWVDGNSVSTANQVIINAAADAMAQPVAVEGTIADFVMRPVIVGRVPQDMPGAGGLDLSVINPVSSAQFVRVTTQNTRKAGRGV